MSEIFQWIVVGVVLAIAAIKLILSLVKRNDGDHDSCSCGCSGCELKDKCKENLILKNDESNERK